MDASVSHKRDIRRPARQGCVIDSGQLRYANACHYTCCADGSRPHTYFDSINACVDQRLCPLPRSHVAADNIYTAECRVSFQPGDHIKHQPGMAMGGIDYKHIYPGLH